MTARLFVAVWPSAAVVEQLGVMHRPVVDGLRWSTPDQWHVTLRFFGEADPEDAAAALSAVHHEPLRATMGPAGRRLGRGAFVLPVAGMDSLAATVVEATRGIGTAPADRPFTGHLTIARIKDGARPILPNVELEAEWMVTEVTLVRSELRPEGARYTVVHTVPMTTVPQTHPRRVGGTSLRPSAWGTTPNV